MARVDLGTLPVWGKQVEGAYEGGSSDAIIFPARQEHNAKVVLWCAASSPCCKRRRPSAQRQRKRRCMHLSIIVTGR